VALTRYRIVEDVPSTLYQAVPARLKEWAFRDIDATTDERSFGWTNIDDMLDVGFTQSPPEKAHYLAFSLRLETRRVQPAVFKKHYQIALKAETAKAKEQGKNFLSRDRKRELKEQVELKLRARALPVPAVFNALWNTQNNQVWLDTTNSKARALFEDQFAMTFELHLEPLSPFFLALEMLGEDAAASLENLEPTLFV
jgi:DNA recombination-dependent growth factor C